jgi:hypothetical protein
MRLLDDSPPDPDVLEAIEAIDATLAGEPVDPRHAELAELALLLQAERPRPSDEFARSLDRRVEARFARRPSAAAKPRPARAKRWALLPAAGVVAAVAIAVVVVVSAGGSHRLPVSQASSSSAARAPHAAATPATLTPGVLASHSSSSAAGNTLNPYPGLQLPQTNRKVVQSAQLQLSAGPDRIDAVAQEVFDVVGAQSGFVSSSTVTATGSPNGYAQFQLSVPSSTLSQTMSELSRMRYAQVVSRTDSTSDITSQFNTANQQLTDAQALRTSLLKQLANAVTETQISSVQQQLHDADGQISAAQTGLRSLNHQVSYSQVSVSLQASAARSAPAGGFTFRRALHDAGRVLTVSAGIALIALAVMVPLGLVAAAGWSIAAAIRRRRREQALDAA